MSGEKKQQKGVRWSVFIPAFAIIGGGDVYKRQGQKRRRADDGDKKK